MSDELPVITSIDELPESAIEELTCGNEPAVVEKTPNTKSATKPKKVEEVAEPVAETAVVEEKTAEVAEVAEEVKPKRKRRTKAEIEAAKKAEAEANAQ